MDWEYSSRVSKKTILTLAEKLRKQREAPTAAIMYDYRSIPAELAGEERSKWIIMQLEDRYGKGCLEQYENLLFFPKKQDIQPGTELWQQEPISGPKYTALTEE